MGRRKLLIFLVTLLVPSYGAAANLLVNNQTDYPVDIYQYDKKLDSTCSIRIESRCQSMWEQFKLHVIFKISILVDEDLFVFKASSDQSMSILEIQATGVVLLNKASLDRVYLGEQRPLSSAGWFAKQFNRMLGIK